MTAARSGLARHSSYISLPVHLTMVVILVGSVSE